MPGNQNLGIHEETLSEGDYIPSYNAERLFTTLESVQPCRLSESRGTNYCAVCWATHGPRPRCDSCGYVNFCRPQIHGNAESIHKSICYRLNEDLRVSYEAEVQFKELQGHLRIAQQLMDAEGPDPVVTPQNIIDRQVMWRQRMLDHLYPAIQTLLCIHSVDALEPAIRDATYFLDRCPDATEPGFSVIEAHLPTALFRMGRDQEALDLGFQLIVRETPRSSFATQAEYLAYKARKRRVLSPRFYQTDVFHMIGFRAEVHSQHMNDPSKWMNYAHLILHKVKALMAICAMENVQLVSQRTLPWLIPNIQLEFATTTMTNRQAFVNSVRAGEDLLPWKQMLMNHISRFFTLVDSRCQWFWPLLQNIALLRTPLPEARRVALDGFGCIYAAFKETPDAMDFMKWYIDIRISKEEIDMRISLAAIESSRRRIERQ